MEYRVFQWWPRLLRNFNFHTFLKHPACESVQKGFRAAVFYFLWSNMRFLFVMVSHLLWILTFVCIDITMMNDDFFTFFFSNNWMSFPCLHWNGMSSTSSSSVCYQGFISFSPKLPLTEYWIHELLPDKVSSGKWKHFAQNTQNIPD